MDNVDDSEGKIVQFLMFILTVLSMQASIFLSISTVTIFLNLIPFVRKYWFLSFVSFCGISVGYLVVLFCDNLLVTNDNWQSFIKATKPLLIILTTQLVLTSVSFIIFRARFKDFETPKIITNEN